MATKTPKQRLKAALEQMAAIAESLDDDVERVELDTWFHDIRVKIEVKGLGHD